MNVIQKQSYKICIKLIYGLSKFIDKILLIAFSTEPYLSQRENRVVKKIELRLKSICNSCVNRVNIMSLTFDLRNPFNINPEDSWFI